MDYSGVPVTADELGSCEEGTAVEVEEDVFEQLGHVEDNLGRGGHGGCGIQDIALRVRYPQT